MTLALLAMLLQDSADDFLKFKKDSTWTYLELEGAHRTTRILKYVAEEKGVATLEASVKRDGEMKPEPSESMLWHVEKDVFSWSLKKKNGKVDPLFRLLKIGSKKGDTWKVEDGEFKGDVTHAGTAEIKVPAGTYKEAIRLDLKGKDMTASSYLVPKVGLLLVEMEAGGERWRLELTEFKEAK